MGIELIRIEQIVKHATTTFGIAKIIQRKEQEDGSRKNRKP
jgi:hypothetical protein